MLTTLGFTLAGVNMYSIFFFAYIYIFTSVHHSHITQPAIQRERERERAGELTFVEREKETVPAKIALATAQNQ